MLRSLLNPEYESLSTDTADIDDFNSEIWVEPDDEVPGIQDAIDNNGPDVAVCLESGRYDVQDGSYSEVAVQVDKDNVGIFGQGRSTEIFLPDNITDTDKGKRIVHVGTNAFPSATPYDGFVLKDLQVNGNYQNQGNISDKDDGHNINIHGSDWIVSNVWSINATGDGIEPITNSAISETEHGIITDSHFLDCYEQNIHIHGGRYIDIDNCVCDGEQNNDSLNLYSHKTNVEYIRIQDSYFLNSSERGATLHTDGAGGNGYVAKHIRFINNTVKGHSKAAVHIDGRYGEDIVVRGCDLMNSQYGVYVDAASDAQIVDNDRISGNQKSGIRIISGSGDVVGAIVRDNRNIRDNNQTNGYFGGISVHSQGNTFDNVWIEDNDFHAGTNDSFAVWFREQTAGTYNDVGFQDNNLNDLASVDLGWYPAYWGGNTPRKPIDVTQLKAEEGNEAYHDGTGTGVAGKARHDGSNWYYENGVTESASAEEPQGTYPDGQIVYFTDSGDGSGTGTYVIDDSGNPQGAL